MKFEWDLSELTRFANNLVSADLENTFKRITKEIAEELLKYMRGFTPVGDTGKLIQGWDNNAFLVTPVSGGYKVEIINTTEYAKWVNDGHQAYNQFGGPYPIKDEHRKGVTSPYQWQKGDPSMYVFGHFFVERGILQLSNTTRIEQIIMQELKKWWMSV